MLKYGQWAKRLGLAKLKTKLQLPQPLTSVRNLVRLNPFSLQTRLKLRRGSQKWRQILRNPSFEPFRLFSSEEDKKGNPSLGLGFFDDPQEPLPPPPPSIEVLSSEIASSAKHNLEVVNLGELTLLKGRVSTREVFFFSNSDLVPGKYEGGLKLWKGSLDLVRALQSEIQNGHVSFTGKRVLEVGFLILSLAVVMGFLEFLHASSVQLLYISRISMLKF